MDGSINAALQHLDALLATSVEGADLTDEERLLVTDMVQQLVMGPSVATGPQQQQLLATPAGLNLASQIGQLLPGAMQNALQQQQQPQTQTHMSAAALAAQSLQGAQEQQAQPFHPQGPTAAAEAPSTTGPGSPPLPGPNSFKLNMPGPVVAEVTGLASPSSSSSSSSVSGRSSPAFSHASPQQKRPQQAPAAAARSPATSAQPDPAAQAAADVLTAALEDPHASIEDIVGLFDKVLFAGEHEALHVQQLLLGSPQQQQQQQSVLAGLHQQQQQQPLSQQVPPLQQQPQQPALIELQQPSQARTLQQHCLEHSTTPEQQQQQVQGLQPGLSVLGTPGADSSQQIAVQAYLLQKQKQQEQAQHSMRPATAKVLSGMQASTASAVSGNRVGLHASAQWPSGSSRPSTAPTAGGSRMPGGISSPPQAQRATSRASGAAAAAAMLHGPQAAAAAAAAAAVCRSQSPDVFKRLSAMSTGALSASNAQLRPRNSNSPIDIERGWLTTLRGGDAAAPAAAARPMGHSSSDSRSRSCSPPAHMPWIIAACVQGARGTGSPVSPGAVEWDVEARSIKPGSPSPDWVGPSSRGRSPDRVAGMGGSVQRSPEPWEQGSSAFEAERRQQQQQQVKKEALKLPRRVLEERMRRFYERNIDWKRRCALVYERQREALKQGETEGCTFAPTINKKSDSMAQELRASYPMKPIRPLTPLADTTADLEQRRQQARQTQQQAQTQRRPASTGRIREGAQARTSNWQHHAGLLDSSDQGVPPAARRLFQDASVRMQRAEQVQRVTAKVERQARSWSAPRCAAAEGVPSRLLDHLDPEKSSSKKQRARNEEQQQQQRSRSARRCTSEQYREWNEFIERQELLLKAKEAKAARVIAVQERRQKMASPELSPGTRRILATKQALAANAGSPQSPTHRIQQDFLDRLQQQSLAQGALGCSPGGGGGEDTASPAGTTTSCGSSSRSAEKAGQGVRPVGAAGARGGGAGGSSGSSGSGRGGDCVLQECTFRPHITARAAARKGRSVEELSEGDRLRREVRLDQMRVMAAARELVGATFKPDLSPSRQRIGAEYMGVPPRLALSGDGLAAYMASLQEKRRELEERRKRAQRQQQEEELRQCTFKPITTPVPAYITEMAEVGYTARYIDRVMQSAVAEGGNGRLVLVAPSVSAVAKALEHSPPGAQGGATADKAQQISTKY